MSEVECPNCGCNTVRVCKYIQAFEQVDLRDRSVRSLEGDEPIGHMYISEAKCMNCDTNLLHLTPGATFAKEPSVRRLITATKFIVGVIDTYIVCDEPSIQDDLDHAKRLLVNAVNLIETGGTR